jgi:hypothetical protein
VKIYRLVRVAATLDIQIFLCNRQKKYLALREANHNSLILPHASFKVIEITLDSTWPTIQNSIDMQIEPLEYDRLGLFEGSTKHEWWSLTR